MFDFLWLFLVAQGTNTRVATRTSHPEQPGLVALEVRDPSSVAVHGLALSIYMFSRLSFRCYDNLKKL